MILTPTELATTSIPSARRYRKHDSSIQENFAWLAPGHLVSLFFERDHSQTSKKTKKNCIVTTQTATSPTNPEVLLIDVRKPEQYAEAHIRN
ncbi:unnamed protein product, partial [Amoebophrya sp. A120]|eukprot:GSA120T00001764001.1